MNEDLHHKNELNKHLENEHTESPVDPELIAEDFNSVVEEAFESIDNYYKDNFLNIDRSQAIDIVIRLKKILLIHG